MINSINQIPLALPYPGNGGFVPADRESNRFQLSASGGNTVAGKAASRPGPVKSSRFTVDEPRRQQEPVSNRQIWSGESNLPHTQILAELINRMGGSGIYSGPGQVLNIAV